MVLLALALVAGAGFAQSKAKWDGAKKQFLLEPGAKLKVGVDSDKWGAQIVAMWDKLHPEAKGAIEYVNFGSAGGIDQITQLQGEAADVCLVVDNEVARGVQSLLALDPVIKNLADRVAQQPFYSNTNPDIKKGIIKFVPVGYNGMAFAWNKTMMEALKLDTADKNKDGLPDAFDTWEKIFALAKKWQTERPTYQGKLVTIVYPMSLDEVWSGYSNATAGGWEIFKEGDPTKPGFEKPEFAAGLEFIKEASDAMVSVEANGAKTPGASMGWRWDEALNNQTSPFFLAGTWMDINGAETKGGYDIKFSKLPTWKGKRLTPFVASKGFVINGFTKFPSAASELFRLIYTKAGIQGMIDNSGYIPAIVPNSPIAPDYSADQNKAEMDVVFKSKDAAWPLPSALLPGNKAKQGMDVYYNIGVNLLYRAVWDGEKTPEQAQAEAVKLAGEWLASNNK
jgi:arabinogalactan oligomer/maltooligosaccharide transport system substrate-binding protein